MIDHVTFEVWEDSIRSGNLHRFMHSLGLYELKVTEDVPDGWNVSWYTDGLGGSNPARILHFVEVPPGERDQPNESPYLGAGHFCVEVDRDTFQLHRAGPFTERDSGSGRLWLRAYGLRVEVRVAGVPVEATRQGFRSAPEEAGEAAEGSRAIEVDKPLAARLPFVPPKGCFVESVPCSYLRGHEGCHSWEVEAIDKIDSERRSERDRYMRDRLERKDIPIDAGPHSRVLDKALEIYEQRSRVYGDTNWRREGRRGSLFNLRRKVERAWDNLWNRRSDDFDTDTLDRELDDLYDVINYAAFVIRSTEEGLEGEWFKDATQV